MYAIQNIKADNTHLVCVVDLLLFSSFSRLKLSADLLLWSKIQTSKIGGQLYSDTSPHKVSQLGAVYVVKSNQTKWRGAIDPTRSAVLSSILLSNVFLPKFFVKFFLCPKREPRFTDKKDFYCWEPYNEKQLCAYYTKNIMILGRKIGR